VIYSTSDVSMLVMPDGPISFDGKVYRSSKGERLYLDSLAKDFKELFIITFVFREGDEGYESNLHSSFNCENITIIELPALRIKNPSVMTKALQFLRVFIRLLVVAKNIDIGYLFLPSYPSALGCLALKIWRKPHIVYGADDWVQASESMFKWEVKKQSLFYKAYLMLNKKMEKSIVHSAVFSVAAGGQLVDKYQFFGRYSYPTTPRMTLSSEDIYDREDTCQNNFIELINVGSLIHDKAQHQLLESFAMALKRNSRLRLKIIGEGPERKNLISLAENLEIISKVEFLGYVESESILYEHLRNADIFVLSSVTEGFPRVLYEAMCMRLPIVTTNVGGIPNLMTNKKNALVVDYGQNVDFANAICMMAEDGSLRKKIIEDASKTLDSVFERMDMSQISKLVIKHLNS
jgi:glycosyltransferase involved in cell wall biosynthesis